MLGACLATDGDKRRGEEAEKKRVEEGLQLDRTSLRPHISLYSDAEHVTDSLFGAARSHLG